MRVFHNSTGAAVAFALFFFHTAASSHVTFETQQAPVDSRYKAVFRIPHGCQGAATVKIRVQVPDGVVGVKPQPKAGWTLETLQGDYAETYTLYGNPVRSGVKEVVWRGGPLPDDQYDEFVFVGYLSDALEPGTTLYFPAIQECEQGVARWIDIPSASQPPARDDHSDSPAPALRLLPPQPAH